VAQVSNQKLHLSETEIAVIVNRLADEIRETYSGKTLVLICVLKGAYAFTADLMRALRMDIELDFVRVTRHEDTVTLIKDISRDIQGQYVLVVEEIIDSGRTSRFLYDRLIQSNPASLEIVTLLNKVGNRAVTVPIKYVGLEVSEGFLVGYGLDHQELGRNSPSISVLN
jgi:hypoxanthine phosphoribosyltransferase